MQGLLFENHDFSMFSSLNRNQASEIYHPSIWKDKSSNHSRNLVQPNFVWRKTNMWSVRFIGCALYLMMRKVRLKHVSFGLQGRSSKLFKIPRFSLPLGDKVSGFLKGFFERLAKHRISVQKFPPLQLAIILANKKKEFNFSQQFWCYKTKMFILKLSKNILNNELLCKVEQRNVFWQFVSSARSSSSHSAPVGKPYLTTWQMYAHMYICTEYYAGFHAPTLRQYGVHLCLRTPILSLTT